MATLADMLAEIADDLERSDTAAFRSKITNAIRHYQPIRFSFNESRDTTFATVASTSVYSWSDIGVEFYAIDGAFVTDGASVLDLNPADYRLLEVLIDGSASENLPTRYARLGSGMRLYPVPNAVYSVRVTGHIKVAAPASDSEADNPWMNEGYDLIKARAKAELYAHRYTDDPAAAQGALIMREAEESAYWNLKGTTARQTGTGSFVPTSF